MINPPGLGTYQVSTQGHKITRVIGEDGHPVINPQMFISYAKARIKAAKELNHEHPKKNEEDKKKDNQSIEDLERLIELFFNNEFIPEFEKAKKEREQAFKLADSLLKNMAKAYKDGDIDEATFAEYKKDALVTKAEAEKKYQSQFNKVYQHNIEKVTQVNALLAQYVDPKKSADKVVKKINQRADFIRAKEERPHQENQYGVLDMNISSSHIPEGELNTSQKALYKRVFGKALPEGKIHTSPSTIRDKNQVGQANALRTEVKINGQTVFAGHRHGSPSVLKINDEAERQHRTLENVKQTMAIAAKEKIESLKKEISALNLKEFDDRAIGGKGLGASDAARRKEIQKILNGEVPLPLDMATMSLLSPVMEGDLLDGMKQYRQVEDSRLAYWSLHGRSVPIEIPGMKAPMNVQLHSTFMSVGVNAARGVETLGAAALVRRVNHRGLNNMIDTFFAKTKPGMGPLLDPMLIKLRQIESNPAIQKYSDRIKNFDKSKLQDAYAVLEACNKALAEPEHREMVDVKKINKEREKALKTIEKEEAKLDDSYKQLATVRKNIYNAQLKSVQTILDGIQTQLAKEGNLKGNANFQKIRLFVDTLDTFYNQPQPGIARTWKVHSATKEKKKILKKMAKEKDDNKKRELAVKADKVQEKIDALNEGNYRFQARFALLAQHMDNFIEWFCKSGEDRTGLLNEHIEAFCIFIEKYGHAPRWDNQEDSDKFHEIMPFVHNGAPNRETNGFNDGCPGLKVTDKDFKMPSVSYETDKKLANISKTSGKCADPKILEKAKENLAQAQKIERLITPQKREPEAETRRSRSLTVQFAVEKATSLPVHPPIAPKDVLSIQESIRALQKVTGVEKAKIDYVITNLNEAKNPLAVVERLIKEVPALSSQLEKLKVDLTTPSAPSTEQIERPSVH